MMRKTKSTLKQCAALVSMLSVLAAILWLFVFLRPDICDTEQEKEIINVKLASDLAERTVIDISSLEWDYKGAFTYDKEPHAVSLVGVPPEIEVVYTDNCFTDAGYYLAKYELVYEMERYELKGALPSPLEWRIDRARPDTEDFVIEDKTVIYDGELHAPDIPDGVRDGVIPIVPEGERLVGEYDIEISFDVDENYIPLSPRRAHLSLLSAPIPHLQKSGDGGVALASIELLGGFLFIMNVALTSLLISVLSLLIFAFFGKEKEQKPELSQKTKLSQKPVGRIYAIGEGLTVPLLPPPREQTCELVLSSDRIQVEDSSLYVRYRSTFESRHIQCGIEAQERYGTVKNKLLSYVGVRCRTSARYESYLKGKKLLARINIKGKTVFLYLPYSSSELDEKYKLEAVEESGNDLILRSLLRIKGKRSLGYALELTERLMAEENIPFSEQMRVDYRRPYEDSLTLARRGLVKLILPKGSSHSAYTDVKRADIAAHIEATSRDKDGEEELLIGV